ncbi:MvdC/MvdD family ATP grasp protein [Streptomyces sp. NPDC006798]|uniref:MvdC/MvdD family ATP grasp protein n=1 Tax=Streptomyces sp. NPDC006798 TaxID=3155462 RepID=UPI00340F1D7B
MSTILVIAAREDWPTDRVVKALTDRGVDVFRMDAEDFPQRLALGGRIEDGNGWTGSLRSPYRRLELGDVSAVYYRTPNPFRFPGGMSGPERRFAAAQARSGLGGIVAALNCRWVSHPSAMSRAEYKPVQLDVARRSGLGIPRR